MVKYISFKIFDTDDYDFDVDILLEKQTRKYYSIVHEDYFEGVIKANLENHGMQQGANSKLVVVEDES